jgi:hypothetical protein
MEHQGPLDTLREKLPHGGGEFFQRGIWWLVGGLAVLVVLWVGWKVYRILTRRAPADRERGLAENLADYPPPSGSSGSRRLNLDSMPMRLRLVVLAAAKGASLDAGGAEQVLEGVLRGLGGIAQRDRPRVRIWPTPLSHQGFARTFHRLVVSPDPAGRPSHWALAAGTARIDQQVVFLGLALWAEEPYVFEPLILKPEEWRQRLQITAK